MIIVQDVLALAECIQPVHIYFDLSEKVETEAAVALRVLSEGVLNSEVANIGAARDGALEIWVQQDIQEDAL